MVKRKLSAVSCAKDEYTMKFAAARVSSSVVNLVSRNVPEEMVVNFSDYKSIQMMTLLEEITLKCCGLVVECRSLLPSDNYLCTILAPASIFKPPLVHDNFQLDVYVFGGLLHKGQLLACDFHYNLALVSIETPTPLQAANFKSIDDDTLSIHPTPDHLHSLRPHSDSFKVLPDTQLVAVSRSFFQPHRLCTFSGTFCSKRPEREFFGARSPTILTCNELYYINFDTYQGLDGVTVVNSLGEIVGILFHTSSFLPSNIISRWWNHYKISGEFRRPIVVGMEVGNLYDADLESLAEFITKFPGVSSGVVVSKVDKDSAASRSGIRVNDVLLTLDGKPVQSKLKFYELIWDKKAGKSVELDVLRVSNGEKLNLSLVIEDASTEKFHQWSDPHISRQ